MRKLAILGSSIAVMFALTAAPVFASNDDSISNSRQEQNEIKKQELEKRIEALKKAQEVKVEARKVELEKKEQARQAKIEEKKKIEEAKTTCIKQGVEVRKTALEQNREARMNTVRTAFSAREVALQAYRAMPETTDVEKTAKKEAYKKAQADFKAAVKVAQKEFITDNRSVEATAKKVRTACNTNSNASGTSAKTK